MSDVRGKSATAVSRTKKPSKLTADERAFLNRIRSLNEKESENLSLDDTIAYINLIRVDPGALRYSQPVLMTTASLRSIAFATATMMKAFSCTPST
jgi:hypothetical protein